MSNLPSGTRIFLVNHLYKTEEGALDAIRARVAYQINEGKLYPHYRKRFRMDCLTIHSYTAAPTDEWEGESIPCDVTYTYNPDPYQLGPQIRRPIEMDATKMESYLSGKYRAKMYRERSGGLYDIGGDLWTDDSACSWMNSDKPDGFKGVTYDEYNECTAIIELEDGYEAHVTLSQDHHAPSRIEDDFKIEHHSRHIDWPISNMHLEDEITLDYGGRDYAVLTPANDWHPYTNVLNSHYHLGGQSKSVAQSMAKLHFDQYVEYLSTWARGEIESYGWLVTVVAPNGEKSESEECWGFEHNFNMERGCNEDSVYGFEDHVVSHVRWFIKEHKKKMLAHKPATKILANFRKLGVKLAA